VIDIGCGMFIYIILITLKQIPSVTHIKNFYHEKILDFVQKIFASIVIMYFLSFILFDATVYRIIYLFSFLNISLLFTLIPNPNIQENCKPIFPVNKDVKAFNKKVAN